MFGPFLLVVVAVPTVLIVLTAWLILGGRRDLRDDPALTGALRRSGRATVVSAVAGAAALIALLVVPGLRYGLDAALTPLAAGAAMIVVIAVGEATWPAPAVTVRTASLTRRGWLSAAPRWLLATGVIGFLALWILDVAAWIAAAPDGRSLATSAVTAQGLEEQSAGPFPGALYAAPTLALSAVVTVAAVITLVVVSRRGGIGDAARDAVLRRASAHRVLRVWAAAHLLTFAGHAVFAGSAIARTAFDNRAVEGSGAVLTGSGWVCAVVALAVAVAPARWIKAPVAEAPTPVGGLR